MSAYALRLSCAKVKQRFTFAQALDLQLFPMIDHC